MSGLGVDFIPGLHASFIEERGISVVHFISLKCTCQVNDTYSGLLADGQTNRRQPYCNRCGGDGWLFRDPKSIIGMVTSIRGQRNILDAGIMTPGDMVFSPKFSENLRKIGAWDKIIMSKAQPLDEGQVIVRGAGTTNENQGLATFLSDDQDRLWYEPETSIWCEDDNGVVYSQNSDFTLGPGRIITWKGNRPIKGLPYVIKYNAFMEWVAFQPSLERFDRVGDIGQAVYLRKRHIAIVNSSPFAVSDDSIPLSSRVTC